MSDSESQDPETLSLLVMFDELVRNEKVISFSYFMFLISVIPGDQKVQAQSILILPQLKQHPPY